MHGYHGSNNGPKRKYRRESDPHDAEEGSHRLGLVLVVPGLDLCFIGQPGVSLDLPLSSFTGLTARAHVAQLVLSSDTSTVFVDNLYFHK